MTGSQEQFQQAMNQGHSAAWDQNWENAVKYYQQALEEFPDQPRALTSLGLALLEQQRYEEAMTCYKRAAAVAPNDPLPLEKIAQICERVGRLNDAIQASLQVAELHLKNHDVDRAIESWTRITRYNADHLAAHSRLAVVYERTGRKAQAVEEYMAVASIVQRAGSPDKALQAVSYALGIMPENASARQALALLQANQPLPPPMRTRGGTGSLRVAQARHMENQLPQSTAAEVAQLDPIAEARQNAMIVLADYLFQQADQKAKSQPIRRGAGSILKGGENLTPEESEVVEQGKLLRYLGQAIDSQTQGNDSEAANNLTHAIESGLTLPAAYFNLGLLTADQESPDEALRSLQTAVKSPDYTLAARLLGGQILKKAGRTKAAAEEYLEALKIGDAETSPKARAEEIGQLYDPIIATQIQQMEPNDLSALCDNVVNLLMRPDWRSHLAQAREQLPAQPEGRPPLLLAEMLLQTSSTMVVESLSDVRKLTEQNFLRTAMEEAYNALMYAPTYLPLHAQIGDILLKEERVDEAIVKFSTVARAYAVRGEANQACNMLRRLVQLVPSDLNLRKLLIEQLVDSAQIDEAIRANMDLADIYYHMADLETARGVYVTALKVAQSSPTNRTWVVEILNRMADIDLQRLDLRQALRIFEQIRTMQPNDAKVRINIIALNSRMSQETAARSELEGFMSYLQTHGQAAAAALFIRNLGEEHPELAEWARRVIQAIK